MSSPVITMAAIPFLPPPFLPPPTNHNGCHQSLTHKTDHLQSAPIYSPFSRLPFFLPLSNYPIEKNTNSMPPICSHTITMTMLLLGERPWLVRGWNKSTKLSLSDASAVHFSMNLSNICSDWSWQIHHQTKSYCWGYRICILTSLGVPFGLVFGMLTVW